MPISPKISKTAENATISSTIEDSPKETQVIPATISHSINSNYEKSTSSTKANKRQRYSDSSDHEILPEAKVVKPSSPQISPLKILNREKILKSHFRFL